ncbi:hypothetical protein CRE_19774 [Caenorhabditis remanei]|uniref:BTB domain-containing protein n=1 Tax=Caenorhabditis remanei TaxID=31234 RepID=E3MT95_CAERE|nr:hypothetical protein CRE_19774 [Caenorhabditis remanei]
MSATPKMSIYESTFAQSDKTDAILVVEGKKLHVNKSLLSCHSTYFKTMFNSAPGSSEFQIDNVSLEEFATLLSQFQLNPIKPTRRNVENVLKLADRFALPAAKRYVELYLMTSYEFNFGFDETIRIAKEHELYCLLERTICWEPPKFIEFIYSGHFKTLPDKVQAKILHSCLDRYK